MNDQLPNQPSFISLHVGSRGRYYWDIKINIIDSEISIDADPEFIAAGIKKIVSGPEAAIETISHIDKKLRDKFPNNAAEMKNSSRYDKLDEFEE